MFEGHVETCIDWTSFDFWFKDFFSNVHLLNFAVLLINQPLIDLDNLS